MKITVKEIDPNENETPGESKSGRMLFVKVHFISRDAMDDGETRACTVTLPLPKADYKLSELRARAIEEARKFLAEAAQARAEGES